jgi:hypothetical protein
MEHARYMRVVERVYTSHADSVVIRDSEVMSPLTLHVSSFAQAFGPHLSSLLALFCSNLIHAGPARTGGRATLVNKPLQNHSTHSP